MSQAVLATATLWAGLIALANGAGGRAALLRVMTEPGFRTGRALALRGPCRSEHLRAEVRYLRAVYRCWRKNY